MSTDKIVSELQNVNPSAVIELFTLTLDNSLHGATTTYRFHAGTSLKDNGEIIWQGNSYTRYPVQAEGFQYGKGQLPRPTLTFSNAVGTISAILLTVNAVTTGNDLTGATVKRIRTQARFIDAANFPSNVNPYGTPDNTAEYPQEIYVIDRKAAENRTVVSFDPKESCGLLLNIRGKEKYFPCQNLSITSHQCFIMNPEDYVVADSIGEIIGIVHSHPTTPPVASEADKISCEESKLPWYIVNPKIETWGYYEPCGYKAPLLGRPWVWGVTDCLSLVEDWYLEEKQISFKKATRPLTPEIFAENPQSKEDGDFDNYLTTAGFRLLAPNEKLQNGDVLAMSILGKGLNHVGIFIDGDVLHHLGDRLSCKEPYNPWLLKCTGGRYRYASQN